MSELSELIEINRNIERQNDEIIRLLKKIAGEEDDAPDAFEYVKMESIQQEIAEKILSEIPGRLLENEPEVGVVHFIDDRNIFRLTVENNETKVDNLTGSSRPTNFKCQELIANESIKRNQPIPESTVILDKDQATELPILLKMCYDQGAKNIFLPWYSMTQIIGAPETLMEILKLDFYKTEEQLIEKVFG